MTRAADPVVEWHPEVGCITCGDEGVEMRVLDVDEARALAACANAEGHTSEVDLGIVSGVRRGDALLVHAGVALTRLENQVVA
jgi:hydrogenase maturation factor